jgi:lipopolysaccharide transport system ATP-binding protein
MNDVVIKFENISKQYRLGLVSTRTLSHDLNRWWQTSVMRREDPYLKVGETNDRSTKGASEYVWALRDITFDVRQGEVLGIIGKNGAGKSTLLKILSRVTAPTTGTIKAKGRIASLLEVGTGFHPELTGRENIYMNGSIMGMTKAEITRKLDEIVNFAGVERYLDTPVKRYSSGMTVRLGFSIAAHLEPEILVVDEVLAVGDAEFQKKALGKMQDVSRGEGRTVLFVSHNMTAVKNLCFQGVVLKNGKVSFIGKTNEAVDFYLSNYSDEFRKREYAIEKAPTQNNIKLILAKLTLHDQAEIIFEGDSFDLEFIFSCENGDAIWGVTFHLCDEMNSLVFVGSTVFDGDNTTSNGIYRAVCTIPPHLMNEGNYRISRLLFVKNRGTVMFEMHDVLFFNILAVQKNMYGWQGKKEGVVKPLLIWNCEIDAKKN